VSEFQVESNVTKRSKWRDTTLKHKEGQPLFAAWQKFRAALSDSLSGVPKEPQAEGRMGRIQPNTGEDYGKVVFSPQWFHDMKYW